MKVIDLLNKIANGEEVPKKIKWNDDILFYDKDSKDYCYEKDDVYTMFEDYVTSKILNDEVEIIEEPKKIEKLYFHDLDNISDNEKILLLKIDKIIDIINGGE